APASAPVFAPPPDSLRARGPVSGGSPANPGRDLAIRLVLDVLGVSFRHVSGYRSGERVRLALQRSEVHFYADTTPGYRGSVEPTMVKEGSVIPLFVDPMWDGRSFSNSKQVEGLPLEAYQEFYKRVKGSTPTGVKWEAYLSLVTLNGTMQRLFALPPGAPPMAVSALRAALVRVGNDKAYAEDALKTMGYVPEYEAGTDTSEKVRAALTVRPEVRNFVTDYIKAAN